MPVTALNWYNISIKAMTQKLFSIIAILFLALSANLFTANAQSEANDPEAKTVLENVQKKYKSLKTFKADFTLTMVNTDTKLNESQKGKIYVKGNKYRVETPEFERISDNVFIWTHYKQEKEVQITDLDPTAGELSPAQLFNFKLKDFKYVMRNGPGSSSSATTEVDLSPLKNNSQYYKIRLTINTKTNTIAKATIFERNGNRFHYELSNLQADLPLDDQFFGFDKSKYPGVEIVDLR